jgi:NAD(P)-dependent dehydrogenase (short-subunit alcohol dehydrogenase family)
MNPKYNFADKVVIVTGAAQGIGQEIARRFLYENAIVALVDKNKDALENFTKEFDQSKYKFYQYIGDVSDEKFVVDTVSDLYDKQKTIDILVNNAGIYEPTFSILEMDKTTWDRTLAVNLTGTFLVCREVSKIMVDNKIKGSIVNMSSTNGLVGERNYIAYNASKGGVTLLTKGMSLDLAEYGIRVNAVCPGYITTEATVKMDGEEFVNNYVKSNIPLNRSGTVEDVAGTFLFLASDDAKFITGTCVVVDGGQLAG